MSNNIASILASLAQEAINRELSIATAESCTGGWIAKSITDLPGSSCWFDCGFVTYSNEAKQRMLDVSEELLSTHGAVSQEVVESMCQGALKRSAATCSVSVSGVAGPDGGSLEKPVGTVWIAWLVRGKAPVSKLFCFEGDRDSIRRQTVEKALAGLLEELTKQLPKK